MGFDGFGFWVDFGCLLFGLIMDCLCLLLMLVLLVLLVICCCVWLQCVFRDDWFGVYGVTCGFGLILLF